MTGQDESDQDHDKRGREARGPRAVDTLAQDFDGLTCGETPAVHKNHL
jgi:hypothetical protein